MCALILLDTGAQGSPGHMCTGSPWHICTGSPCHMWTGSPWRKWTGSSLTRVHLFTLTHVHWYSFDPCWHWFLVNPWALVLRGPMCTGSSWTCVNWFSVDPCALVLYWPLCTVHWFSTSTGTSFPWHVCTGPPFHMCTVSPWRMCTGLPIDICALNQLGCMCIGSFEHSCTCSLDCRLPPTPR